MPLLDAGRNDGYIDSPSGGMPNMPAYSVAEAKNALPKLIDRALRGEEVVITRRGKAVVELRPASLPVTPAKGIHEWLRAPTRARPSVGLTSVEILDLVYEPEKD
jgi:prevent-host-death family protein